MWEINITDECRSWYEDLEEPMQTPVGEAVQLLSEHGPALRRPVIGEIQGSAFGARMKELRVSAQGRSLRVLFMFDPRRQAILLVGGDKTGLWEAWYETAIPRADELCENYLDALRREGEIE